MTELVNGARPAPLLAKVDLVSTPARSGSPAPTGTGAAAGLAVLGLVTARTLAGPVPTGLPAGPLGMVDAQCFAVLAVLAGVHAATLTGRSRVRAGAAAPLVATLAVRALVFGVLGLALGFAEPARGAVVLPYYALLFALAIPLVLLPTWAVAATGVVALGAVPVLTHRLLPMLPLAPPRNPGLADLAERPLAVLSQLALTGAYPALAGLVALCAGLVLGRLGWSRPKAVLATLAAALGAMAMARATSWLLVHHYEVGTKIIRAAPAGLAPASAGQLLDQGGAGVSPAWSWWWLAADTPHLNTPPELLGTAGGAIGLLAVVALVGNPTWRPARGFVTALRLPLAGLGAIAVSAYCAHVLFVNSDYDHYSPGTSLMLQALTGLSIGMAWRLTAGRDPLETLVPRFGPPPAPATRMEPDRHARLH